MTAPSSDLSKHGDELSHTSGRHELHPLDDVIDYLKCYAREKPETAALICIAIGFVLGWKLKPW